MKHGRGGVEVQAREVGCAGVVSPLHLLCCSASQRSEVDNEGKRGRRTEWKQRSETGASTVEAQKSFDCTAFESLTADSDAFYSSTRANLQNRRPATGGRTSFGTVDVPREEVVRIWGSGEKSEMETPWRTDSTHAAPRCPSGTIPLPYAKATGYRTEITTTPRHVPGAAHRFLAAYEEWISSRSSPLLKSRQGLETCSNQSKPTPHSRPEVIGEQSSFSPFSSNLRLAK